MPRPLPRKLSKVVLSARAERDVERLWAFLASKNPRAADRFLDEIERAYRSLSDFPDRGRPARPDFRELVVPFGRGAYILRYTMSRDRGDGGGRSNLAWAREARVSTSSMTRAARDRPRRRAAQPQTAPFSPRVLIGGPASSWTTDKPASPLGGEADSR